MRGRRRIRSRRSKIFRPGRHKTVSDQSIPVQFPSGQRYDLVLINPDRGERLWAWAMNKSFISAVLDTVFAPGDTFQFDEVIDFGQTGVSAGGVYILEAFLTVGGGEEDGLALKETTTSARIRVALPSSIRSSLPSRADFDESGRVDFRDFVSISLEFGAGLGGLAYEAAFDLDDGGFIGFRDFLIFAAAFGKVP